MTKTAKERIEEEIKEAELSYKMNDRRCGDYIAGTLKGLEIALEHVENVDKPKQPKLSIPKNIAEMLDQEIVADDITKFAMFHEWFERLWLSDDLTKYCVDYKNYALASAYLAGKALGVELVSIEED